MTVDEKLLLSISSSLKECDSHLDRLRRGYSLLKDFFPLTAESMKQLSDDRVALLDQFIYRFTKLQDSMGIRLLPSVYYHLQGSSRTVPFLDILSGLEKFEVIPAENGWQFFRNLRNYLAHDYPESIEQTVKTLNTLVERWSEMNLIYTGVKSFCENKLLS
jgi:hypothetical protein